MTSDERLKSIRAKVERARKHIDDLDIEVNAFWNGAPYEIGTKPSTNNPHFPAHYIVSMRDLPLVVPAIAGDVLFNLRAALDHLVFHLVKANGATPTRNTSFPIIDTDSPVQYQTARTPKVKGMCGQALDAIDCAKPYKGGNDTLWKLHKLNIIDKHRTLTTAVSQLRGMAWDTSVRRQMIKGIYASAGQNITEAEIELKSKTLFVEPDVRRCPLTKGDILYVDPFRREANDNVQFEFQASFYEPPIAECEPVLETLRGMADCVDRLIISFKPWLL